MSQIKETIIQLTDERKRLYEVSALIEVYGLEVEISKRPETTLAFRATQRAFMWLGKAKGALGSTNPYPNSTNTANQIIEPPQDGIEALSEKVTNELVAPLNEIADDVEKEIFFAKALRGLLDGIVKAIKNDMSVLEGHKIYHLCIENAFTAAEEGKMWLGLVLGKIRDEGGKSKVKKLKPAKKAKKAVAKDKPAKKAKPEKTSKKNEKVKPLTNGNEGKKADNPKEQAGSEPGSQLAASAAAGGSSDNQASPPIGESDGKSA